MTKICKHCGHAKYYHLETEPYCEFCAEAIHSNTEFFAYGTNFQPNPMAIHKFEEVKPEYKYLFMSVKWRGRKTRREESK